MAQLRPERRSDDEGRTPQAGDLGRLKILRHATDEKRTVAGTCGYFGISRKTYYQWERRFRSHGEAGLSDRPRAPQRCPRATPPEVVSKVLYLRQQYHFGAGRIADDPRRFHQVAVARSTVHRLLGTHGLGRLPANQKRKRLYQFTAIDDCTRIRVRKVFDACKQATAIRFIDDVFRRLPFRVHVVPTDNGAEFQSQFQWHLETQDVRHVYIRPRSPHLNGKVERSHRSMSRSSTSSSTKAA